MYYFVFQCMKCGNFIMRSAETNNIESAKRMEKTLEALQYLSVHVCASGEVSTSIFIGILPFDD